MIVLVHNILPPYRVPLFNSISACADGKFAVVLTRLTHARRRQWHVPVEDVAFRYELLDTYGLEWRGRALDVSFGVQKALDRLRPDRLVVAGWDVHACWTAQMWARRRCVPVFAWVESSARTGTLRGSATKQVRRAFLASCQGAIVPGRDAERFVQSVAPGTACYVMPNSVAAPELRQLEEAPLRGAALYVGELSDRKGVDLLLDAVPDLLATFTEVIVAGDGRLRPQVAALAAREPRVRYVGFVEGAKRADIMRGAAVVLVPSRADPWPLVACEALVAARPVVLGSGVGSASDLEGVGGQAVVTMDAPTRRALVAAARMAAGASVPSEARDAFTAEKSAQAFLAAVCP